MPNLDAVVKAYDIRGTVPDQLDATLAHAFGVAFAKFSDAKTIVVGHDMRPSGLSLIDAFQNGLTEQGVDVINLGLASTDMLYFASGKLNALGYWMPNLILVSLMRPKQVLGRTSHCIHWRSNSGKVFAITE